MAAITERPEELPLTVEISVESNLFHNFASLANLCGLAAITERPEELPLTVEISVFKPVPQLCAIKSIACKFMRFGRHYRKTRRITFNC